MSDDETMAAVRDWAARTEAALGLELELDLDAVLGIAGLAARAVVRPAAPVTTYLVGYAAGLAGARGVPADVAFAEAVATVRALAESRDADRTGGTA